MRDKIVYTEKGSVGTILLNDPKQLNCFTLDMIKQLDKTLDRIKKSSVKVVIITGAGSAFCSGGNIAWEQAIGMMSKAKAVKQISFVQKTMAKIESLPQVVIALVNGYAVGGGNELAMACDIRVALPGAVIIHPETKLGTIAPLGGTRRLTRLVGLGRAKYILFTGTKVDAKTAVQWGLVDFVVEKKKVKTFLNKMVGSIAKSPLKALAVTKKSVNREYTKDLTDSFERSNYVARSQSAENKASLKKFLSKKN